MAKEELILYSFASLVVLYLLAVGIYLFERTAQPENFSSLFDSLWWAVATLTTWVMVMYFQSQPVVGYLPLSYVLSGSVAVPRDIVASSLSQVKEDTSER